MSIADVDAFFLENRILLDIVDGKVVVSIGKYKVETKIPEEPGNVEEALKEAMGKQYAASEEDARVRIEGTEASKTTEAGKEKTEANEFMDNFGKLYGEYVKTVEKEEDREFYETLWKETTGMVLPGSETTEEEEKKTTVAESAETADTGKSTKQTRLGPGLSSARSRSVVDSSVKTSRYASPLFQTSRLFQSDLTAVSSLPAEQQ